MPLMPILLCRGRYGVEDLLQRRLRSRPRSTAADGEPVRQGFWRELFDVLGPHEVPPPRGGARLGHPDQSYGTARRGPQRDRGVLAGRLGDGDRVAEHLVVDLDRPHELSGLQDLPYLYDGFDLFERTPLDLGAYDPTLRVVLRVAHARRHHKPVELPLGQRIRPVELVRVLGRDDEERLGQGTRGALHRNLSLRHRLQERALRARGGAVDLIGQQHRREHGTWHPQEMRLPGIVDARPRDIRGQEVGGELDAREVGRQRGRDGPRQRRLADPRYVRKQDMAPREKGDQAQLHDPVLAHYHPAYRAKQPLVDLPNLYRTFDPTTLYGYPSRKHFSTSALQHFSTSARSSLRLSLVSTSALCCGKVCWSRASR